MANSYLEVLDDSLKREYESSGSEISLESEIRLVRAFLRIAAKDGDEKAVKTACTVLARLIPVQASLGGPGELDKMLAEVGEEVIQKEERRATPPRRRSARRTPPPVERTASPE